jgi:hypothetical protein
VQDSHSAIASLLKKLAHAVVVVVVHLFTLKFSKSEVQFRQSPQQFRQFSSLRAKVRFNFVKVMSEFVKVRYKFVRRKGDFVELRSEFVCPPTVYGSNWRLGLPRGRAEFQIRQTPFQFRPPWPGRNSLTISVWNVLVYSSPPSWPMPAQHCAADFLQMHMLRTEVPGDLFNECSS